MKRIINYTAFVLLILILAISCEKRNIPPTCKITAPSDSTEFYIGSQLIISVEADDEDGFIYEIRFYINDVGVGASSSFPFKYDWDTSQEDEGIKTIKVIAKDDQGTSVEDKISVLLKSIGIPQVTTSEVTEIEITTAISGGNIITDGGEAVTERGVCWSIRTNPTISDNATSDGNGTGIYSSSVTGLASNTTYYVRAYATNSIGIAYGNEVSFVTQEPPTGDIFTDIDGNEYSTIIIGTQVWMAENLKTTKYNDGTDIPNVTDNTEWENLSTGAYAWYDNDQASNGDTYGALYNWYAVETGQLCPVGWHVPTDEEWTTLNDYLGGEKVAGGKLKEAGTTHWKDPNEGATNETGFTALPGGYRISNGTFYYIGDTGYWWSATEGSTIDAWSRGMYFNNSNVSWGSNYKEDGFSVRCLRD
jgi:uncharacterized protein (TIGR02145 family)